MSQHHDNVELQQSLNHFDHKYGLGHKPLKVDGVRGHATNRRILTIAFYLGYGDNRREIPQDPEKLSRFVRRLRHPKTRKYVPRDMIKAGKNRRRHRRHVLASHKRGGIGKVLEVYRWCQAVHNAGRPYLWGGGHGSPLRSLGAGSGFDCSGSCSWVLYKAGLYREPWARVSGGFERWGAAGPGRYMTIYCNWEHIWLHFKLAGKAWRFDTSPQSCGSHGPRLRWCSRFTSGFHVRHVPGL